MARRAILFRSARSCTPPRATAAVYWIERIVPVRDPRTKIAPVIPKPPCARRGHATETGILFHSMDALSRCRKVGITAIGNRRIQAEETDARALEVPDREAVR